jgi:hypothetical protein
MNVRGCGTLLGFALLVAATTGGAAPLRPHSLELGLSASGFAQAELNRAYGWLPGLELRLAIPRPRGAELILGLSAERSGGDAYYETDTFNAEASLSRYLLLAGVRSHRQVAPSSGLDLALLITLGTLVEDSPALAWGEEGQARHEYAHFGLRGEGGPSWDLGSSPYRLSAALCLGKGMTIANKDIAEPSRTLYLGFRLGLSRQLGGA